MKTSLNIEIDLWYRFVGAVQSLVEDAEAMERAVDGEWGTDGHERETISEVKLCLKYLGED